MIGFAVGDIALAADDEEPPDMTLIGFAVGDTALNDDDEEPSGVIMLD